MAIGSYVLYIGYSILPALEVHLLQTKLHALLSGAGLSTLLDLNKATLSLVLQKVPSEANPRVRNHGEGPY